MTRRANSFLFVINKKAFGFYYLLNWLKSNLFYYCVYFFYWNHKIIYIARFLCDKFHVIIHEIAKSNRKLDNKRYLSCVNEQQQQQTQYEKWLIMFAFVRLKVDHILFFFTYHSIAMQLINTMQLMQFDSNWWREREN